MLLGFDEALTLAIVIFLQFQNLMKFWVGGVLNQRSRRRSLTRPQ